MQIACIAVALATLSSAHADVWITHGGVLERRDGDGAVQRTIPFSARADARVGRGTVDPATGNVWLVFSEAAAFVPVPSSRVIGFTPSGDEIWRRTESGPNFSAPSIAIDTARHGVWVTGSADPGVSDEIEVALFDQTTGRRLATVHGLGQPYVRIIGADGALFVASSSGSVRIEGSAEELDGYEVVGPTGPHHRTLPATRGSIAEIDRSDGSLYSIFQVFDGSTDTGVSEIFKLTPDGNELFRVAYPIGIYESITDVAADPRDGSVYVTFGFYGGRISHVSPLGTVLGTGSYGENVTSVAVDPEESAVWIGHMPTVDDDKAGIAPMILRKLDATLETVLEVPFPSVVNVIGAAPQTTSREISLDVQPQDKRNVVDLRDKHSETRVALLSSASFDPLQVDLDTIRFGTAGATVRWHWTRDANADGSKDVVVTFKTRHTGIKCRDTAAPLTAETFAGATVHGSGWLRAKCKRPETK